MNYWTLLKTDSTIKSLWLIQLFVCLGAWFTNVALFYLLADWGVSASVIALFSALHFLPGVLQAPISGTIVDKTSPKKLMSFLLIIEVSVTLLFLFITDKSYLPVLALLVFTKMTTASLFFTTQMTLLPKITKEDQLHAANDLFAVTWSFCFVAGMALGGLVVEFYGVSVAFCIDALMFFIALFFLRGLFLPEQEEMSNISFYDSMKQGWLYLKNHPLLWQLILLHATIGLTNFDALTTLLAKNYYIAVISIPLAIGSLNAIRALGLAIGPIVFSRFKDKKRLLSKLFWAEGMALVIWATLQQEYHFSLIGSLLAGFFTATIWSITYSMIQQATQTEYLGRVIAYNDMVFLLANIATAFFIGILADIGVSLPIITFLLAGGFFITAFIFPRLMCYDKI